MRFLAKCSFPIGLFILVTVLASSSLARNPFRRAFFDVYPQAENTALDNLPSNQGHCGLCHFDFDGSDQRNPYGLGMEIRMNAGMSAAEAVLDMELEDSDNDGFSNLVEITDYDNFSNTPTFPGLKDSNVGNVVNVDLADLDGILTPSGGSDITGPTVTVITPTGGEALDPNTFYSVQYLCEDESGVASVEVFLVEDGGAHLRQLAKDWPGSGTEELFIPNLPGTGLVLRLVARDNAGNLGSGDSSGFISINPHIGGVVPTTLRDFDMPGTQPFGAGVLEDPATTCITCHGEFDPEIEPWHNWQGSMMAQAMTDPLFLATMSVANSFVPASGDLCLRCHTPGGWSEGRSFDTTGGMLTPTDMQGVQCDFCHRQVDPHYDPMHSPAIDYEILGNLEQIPVTHANGQFVMDPDPTKRGPYEDAEASHQFLYSDFTLSANLCGTCHDVSNPAFIAGSEPGLYHVQELDTAHPDGDPRNMFPVERTFSEWTASEYAAGGVYQPQFAGDKPDGMVSTCQDCHMRDVTGVGSNVPGSPSRTDLGLHDLTGANTFVPDIIPDFFPDVDTVALQDGKLRAQAMLSLAASMELSASVVDGHNTLTVRVTNETGHKLPSGYPEGRRTWLNVRAFDASDNLVYESGAYDPETGELGHDADAKIYHIVPGISSRLAPVLNLPYGPSFHFALNDTVFLDNRIPPRGFTNAGFLAVQSPVVDYTYEDGQYWDDTVYTMPANAQRIEVAFYYQTTSKGYIEFLRDSNTVDTLGQQLYDAWVNHGRSAPVAMAQQTLQLDVSGAPDENLTPRVTTLGQNFPNPFNPQTRINFSLSEQRQVTLRIYDERGHLVSNLVDQETLTAGAHQVVWLGMDNAGRGVASGVYHYVLDTGITVLKRKMTLVR